MPKVTFIVHSGKSYDVDAGSGSSVMEAAVAKSVPGIDALCGGVMACATCHVYVDPDWETRLTPKSEDEASMLDALSGAQPNSRLACQIRLTEALDGLIVRVPESQS